MELTYGVAVKVTKDVVAPGAMMPKAGTIGTVINASQPLVVCEFTPPFDLASGGRALHDPNQTRGVRVKFSRDEFEAIPKPSENTE